MDDYFKSINEIGKINLGLDKLFEPYTNLSKEIRKQYTEPITQLRESLTEITNVNLKLKEQLDEIFKPIVEFQQISQKFDMSGFISSYNSTKKLIDDFEEFEHVDDEDRLIEIRQAKEQISELPDIEPAIDSLSNQQKEEVEELATEVFERLKNKERIEDVNKIATGYLISEELSNAGILDGFEKYTVIIDILLSLFF